MARSHKRLGAREKTLLLYLRYRELEKAPHAGWSSILRVLNPEGRVAGVTALSRAKRRLAEEGLVLLSGPQRARQVVQLTTKGRKQADALLEHNGLTEAGARRAIRDRRLKQRLPDTGWSYAPGTVIPTIEQRKRFTHHARAEAWAEVELSLKDVEREQVDTSALPESVVRLLAMLAVYRHLVGRSKTLKRLVPDALKVMRHNDRRWPVLRKRLIREGATYAWHVGGRPDSAPIGSDTDWREVFRGDRRLWESLCPPLRTDPLAHLLDEEGDLPS